MGEFQSLSDAFGVFLLLPLRRQIFPEEEGGLLSPVKIRNRRFDGVAIGEECAFGGSGNLGKDLRIAAVTGERAKMRDNPRQIRRCQMHQIDPVTMFAVLDLRLAKGCHDISHHYYGAPCESYSPASGRSFRHNQTGV